MNYKELPVYQQKDRILDSLKENQVVVVESPTGSGKTTQIPVILNEAGYSRNGIIGVTQPRRIAAISVTEFISRQLGTKVPGLVGYKMRFEDRTDSSTVIKIMTDGILLQEMKLDPLLSRYGVLMVDEAHERSLNIDFILGLLKRVMEARPEFKVVVSSATINADVFSAYFGDCPIVKIDTPMYPVTVVYDPPPVESDLDALIGKVESTVVRIVSERRNGDILIFLPGERAIKDCVQRLATCEVRRYLQIIPLYSRLGKEEQERVFDRTSFGKTKVVVSTNIAETSVTIDGITSVIDSGLAKLNFYNPRTYTSSLIEVPTSKASSNQRKGRAGRTQPGTCYRLFGRDDFENRSLFTMEEIYRTDLSEVVLRMAELGITDFELFDFISKPSKTGIRGAVEALNLLDALNPDRTLSKIGEKMCLFPLLPRHSRILVEAIMNYPDVLEEALIGTAFLSTQGPFILPPGEEMEARAAHHAFRDPAGDFVSYLKIFRQYKEARNPGKYCERNYLDERTMAEIARVKEQLELIIADLGVPIVGGGSTEDYLCAVSRGLIQFVCARQDRGLFRSLTAERIQIHPGSVMFKENPSFIVAGEIVRTTRMYAMSVSPLQKHWLPKISPLLAEGLLSHAAQKALRSQAVKAVQEKRAARDFTNQIKIAGEVFRLEIEKKKKKLVVVDWEALKRVRGELIRDSVGLYKTMKGVITKGDLRLMDGEKLDLILRVAPMLDLDRDIDLDWPRKRNFEVHQDSTALVSALDHVLQVSRWKPKSRELGFVALFTDSAGSYWFRVSRGFHTALNESLASLEALVDDIAASASHEEKEKAAALYRKLSGFFA